MTRILEKNGIDNTNIDGAGFNNFCSGGYSGVIANILNECNITNTSTSITIDTGELIINGFRVVLNETTQFIMSTIPSSVINYSIIAEININNTSDVSFRTFIQPTTTDIIQNNIFGSETGQGIYQIKLATFNYSINGIENLITQFKILTNDYKTYTNSKIDENNNALGLLLSKKVGVVAQVFTEQEKTIARNNIGAISTEQSSSNVKYVYIVGNTAYANDWFSFVVNGNAISPQSEIIYIVKTVGNYYNQQYIYNYKTSLYELTAQPSDIKKENLSNKTTIINANSTDNQYPTAKAVYDIIGDIDTILNNIDNGGGV